MKKLIATLVLLASSVHAEEIRIVTYNIEHWADRFDTRKLLEWAKKQPQSPELDKLVRDERNQDDEDNWEVAQVLLNPKVNPDILFVQEGCGQEDLEYFNTKWFNDGFGTVIATKTNTDRDQQVCILLKKGFKILEKRDQYYKEKDTVSKDFLKTADGEGEASSEFLKENRLFARGPTFFKIESPGGYKFWIGTNHQKSKSGNSADVTKWRNREAARIHEIVEELIKTGDDVVFGGDMNDELGVQEFELAAGGDSIAKIVGTDGNIVCATKPLWEKAEISFGGYMRDRFRSFIDHMFVSKSLQDRVVSVDVYREGQAPSASDHYPVVLVIKSK